MAARAQIQTSGVAVSTHGFRMHGFRRLMTSHEKITPENHRLGVDVQQGDHSSSRSYRGGVCGVYEARQKVRPEVVPKMSVAPVAFKEGYEWNLGVVKDQINHRPLKKYR